MGEEARPNAAERTGGSRPLPSASVIVVRPSRDGFEVFMVRRSARAAAFADVFVFPGGTVRKDDYLDLPGATELTAADALSARGGTPPPSPAAAIALFRAAVRELFEEAGILLALDAADQPLQISESAAPRFAEFRRRLQAGDLTLADPLSQEQLHLDLGRLHYFSHWITPAHLPRRFDTRFFVAELPAGQTALHCQIETTEGVWITPREALERADRGQFGIVFPTRTHLTRIAPYQSVADLLQFADTKPIQTVQTRRSVVNGKERIELPPGAEQCW